MANVNVTYSNFSTSNESIKTIDFAVSDTVTLMLEKESGKVNISLTDSDSESAISGTLTKETLNYLIKGLTLLRNQINTTYSNLSRNHEICSDSSSDDEDDTE